MLHAIDLSSSKTISALRNKKFPFAVKRNAPVVDGMYFRWDTQGNNDVHLDLTRDNGCLFRAEAKTSGAPTWFSLNFDIGKADFARGDLLCIVIDFEADPSVVFHLNLRSEAGGKELSRKFVDKLEGIGDREVKVMLHDLGTSEEAETRAVSQTVTMALQQTSLESDFKFTVHNLGFFVLAAAEAPKLAPLTFADYAR